MLLSKYFSEIVICWCLIHEGFQGRPQLPDIGQEVKIRKIYGLRKSPEFFENMQLKGGGCQDPSNRPPVHAPGFHHFKHQHCPHLAIFVIEYFNFIIGLPKCNECRSFYNIEIFKLENFEHDGVFRKNYQAYVYLANFSQKALSQILNPK